ncbi:hypothetical protein HMPREF1147_1409 [Selenomonas sp. FOBRC9]|nr:hypothetical protein HMPREF1147_1409 [Selenomonas sp. FOBRC9]
MFRWFGTIRTRAIKRIAAKTHTISAAILFALYYFSCGTAPGTA